MVFDQLCVNIRLLLTKVNIELNVNVDMNIEQGRICRIHYNLTDDKELLTHFFFNKIGDGVI